MTERDHLTRTRSLLACYTKTGSAGGYYGGPFDGNDVASICDELEAKRRECEAGRELRFALNYLAVVKDDSSDVQLSRWELFERALAAYDAAREGTST